MAAESWRNRYQQTFRNCYGYDSGYVWELPPWKRASVSVTAIFRMHRLENRPNPSH